MSNGQSRKLFCLSCLCETLEHRQFFLCVDLQVVLKQDVLLEIQRDAARIADQLSGVLPACQSPTWLPDGCDHVKQRSHVTLPAQPATQHAHAPRKAQKQPATRVPAAASHPSCSVDPVAQPHEEALAEDRCSGDAYSGPQQGSAEPASTRIPLLDCGINAPEPGGSGNAQEQDPTEQQHPHGYSALAARCNAAQEGPAAALCSGGSGKSDCGNMKEKNGFARHSWPGAVQRVVRSVFSLRPARLVPSQHTPSKSRQPAASILQAPVAVSVKKARTGVESAAEGIEDAQREGMQAARGGKGGTIKAHGADVIPCISEQQQSGEPVSCPRGGKGLSSAVQRMGHTSQAATVAANNSEMEAAQVPVPITHSQADTTDAMLPAVATQLAMPTDSHLSQPQAISSAPCPPSPQPSKLLLDCEELEQGPVHVAQQRPTGSWAGGVDSEAVLDAVADADATEAPWSDERGASCKRANEDDGSAPWSWALALLPTKRAKITHSSDVISQQV